MTKDSKLKQLLEGRTASAKEEAGSEDRFDASGYNTDYARAFTTANGKRQPGFALVLCHENTRHWIFYHGIRRLKSFARDGREYLQFTHEDLAITIEGQQFAFLIGLIGEGRLKAVFEPDGRTVSARSETDPIITAVRVTDIEELAKADKAMRLVK